MKQPYKAEDDVAAGTVLLYWDDDPKLGIPHRVRGSIVWPVGMIPGYSLIAAQRIHAPKTVSVYAEYPFYNVGTVHGKQGIWKHFTDSWTRYRCRKYYYHPQDEHLRYTIQVAREPLISVKPSFVEAELSAKSESNIDNLILEYQRRKLLRIDRDAKAITHADCGCGNLKDQLDVYAKGFTVVEDTLPAVRALRALMAGLERVSYRQPAPEPERQASYY